MTEDPQTQLDRWVTALESQLGLPAGTVDVYAVLDLTRDAAHGVARPAGPLAAYAAGYAAALGTHDAVARASALARSWSPDGEADA